MSSRIRVAAITFATLAALNWVCSAHAVVQYTLTHLGTLGGTHSGAYGINDLGQVVGGAYTAGSKVRPFLWSGGVMTDLGTLGGDAIEGGAQAINNRGQIVGQAATADGSLHAFLYENGAMTDLGVLAGTTRSVASSINDAGLIAGYAWGSSSTSNSRPFLYNAGTGADCGATLTDLGVLGRALDVNHTGQVVGESWASVTAPVHPFVYDGATFTDLGVFGGSRGAALGINAAGQVVGYSMLVGGSTTVHAFLHAGGVLADLGTLGGASSFANAINDVGQIVGRSQVGPGAFAPYRAFVYDDGIMIDLNTLIPAGSGLTLVEANAINDAGQIVGHGVTPAGHAHAFLLTPVPEPSWALLVLPILLTTRRRSRPATATRAARTPLPCPKSTPSTTIHGRTGLFHLP